MKQLKPRDKITQKMTRDGAVEVNETQQTAERISSREADSNFSQPDTATAERVMEHLDAAHTRKASKKAVKKAQEAKKIQYYFGWYAWCSVFPYYFNRYAKNYDR